MFLLQDYFTLVIFNYDNIILFLELYFKIF